MIRVRYNDSFGGVELGTIAYITEDDCRCLENMGVVTRMPDQSVAKPATKSEPMPEELTGTEDVTFTELNHTPTEEEMVDVPRDESKPKKKATRKKAKRKK